MTRVTADEISTTVLGAGLDDRYLATIAAHATRRSFPAGTVLAREGASARTGYLLRRGRVAIQVRTPGGPLVVETLGAGDVVGWSWRFAPHLWRFDAEVLDDVEAIELDGEALRAACAADTGLDAALTERLAQVVVERLAATRLRLLDLYGAPR